MNPINLVTSYEEFCFIKDEMDILETEKMIEIEDREWLSNNPLTITPERFRQLKILLANQDQIRRVFGK